MVSSAESGKMVLSYDITESGRSGRRRKQTIVKDRPLSPRAPYQSRLF